MVGLRRHWAGSASEYAGRAGWNPPIPRPAATVILLRRGGKHAERGLEVLLVQRNPEARFMPGVWVFPGGAVDAGGRRGRGGASASPRSGSWREEAGDRARPPSELVAYSRWITPEVVPIRFDTRFYLALAPAHSPPQPDGSETVDAGWFEPQAALDSHRAGELPLVFPTIKHLESLVGFANAAEALEAARRREVKPVEPEVVGEGDEQRIVLPDDLP